MADGVYGVAQGATSVNFAARLVGATQPAGGVIQYGSHLATAMGGLPEGWVTYGTAQIRTTVNENLYFITIISVETAKAKAELFKNWQSSIILLIRICAGNNWSRRISLTFVINCHPSKKITFLPELPIATNFFPCLFKKALT